MKQMKAKMIAQKNFALIVEHFISSRFIIVFSYRIKFFSQVEKCIKDSQNAFPVFLT
jgi:hypothetical protein